MTEPCQERGLKPFPPEGGGLDLKRGLSIPSGLVQGLSFKSKEGAASVLKVEDYDGNKTPIDISESEMASALVNYCLSRKVPMPAKSSKGVQVIGGDVTLVLTIQEFDLLKAKRR